MATNVAEIIDPLAELSGKARDRDDVDLIYVNDNFALDAYLRHFSVVVPPDGVAHIDDRLGDAALKMMERNMRAEIIPTAECLT